MEGLAIEQPKAIKPVCSQLYFYIEADMLLENMFLLKVRLHRIKTYTIKSKGALAIFD